MSIMIKILLIGCLSILCVCCILNIMGNPCIRDNFEKSDLILDAHEDDRANKQLIPKHIMMTTHDKSLVPEQVYTPLKRYAIANAKSIPYTIWDDTECIAFLKKYYKPIVLAKFHELTGAHKADLFRYCYLYIKGGIYMDIKTKLTKPLDEMVDFNARGLMYTVLMPTVEQVGVELAFRINSHNVPNYTLFKRGIYQGIIISSPGNYIFLKLIGMCLKTPLSALKINYLLFVQQAYQILKKNSKTNSLAPGLKKLQGIDCYLFQEVLLGKCKNPDRYGFCSCIYDQKEKVCDTRYSDYPWK